MPKNTSKNPNGRDVIKEMRLIGAGVENRLTDKFSQMGVEIKSDLRKEMRRIEAGIKSGLRKEIRHVGVNIENIEHKMDLVIEQQNGMKESFNVRFDAQDEQIDKLVTDVSVMKLDMVVIKDGLKKKADASETVALRRRVVVLEGSK